MKDTWTEEDSGDFIAYGDYFIPNRDTQINIIAELLATAPKQGKIVELGCGEGKLCKVILERYPDSNIIGLDLSDEMLTKAGENLHDFGERVVLEKFNLENNNWRTLAEVRAFVSSLVIHHLAADQKQQLFLDLYRSLSPGGIFVYADVVQPTRNAGVEIAASLWDQAVKKTAETKGLLKAYQEFKTNRWNYFEFPDDDPIDKPSSLADQITWLKNAGFLDVDVFWMNAGHAILGGWKG